MLVYCTDDDCLNITNSGNSGMEIMDAENWQDLQKVHDFVKCSNNLNINRVDKNGNTILYNSISIGKLYMVQMVMQHPYIDLNKQAICLTSPEAGAAVCCK